jgi:hypothetical protein
MPLTSPTLLQPSWHGLLGSISPWLIQQQGCCAAGWGLHRRQRRLYEALSRILPSDLTRCFVMWLVTTLPPPPKRIQQQRQVRPRTHTLAVPLTCCVSLQMGLGEAVQRVLPSSFDALRTLQQQRQLYPQPHTPFVLLTCCVLSYR